MMWLICLLSLLSICSSWHTAHRVVRPRTSVWSTATPADAEVDADAASKAIEQDLKMFRPSFRLNRFDETNELKYLVKFDIGRNENFWNKVYPKVSKMRQQANQERDVIKRAQVDKDYYALMEAGFQRRYAAELIPKTTAMLMENTTYIIETDHLSARPVNTMLPLSFGSLELQEDRTKTREELIQKYAQIEAEEQGGLNVLLPKPIRKYVDYLLCLRKKTPGHIVLRNLAVGLVFTFISIVNRRSRMAFMYTLLGNLMNLSVLLTRGVPQKQNDGLPAGMNRYRMVSYSAIAMYTAVSVVFGSSLAFSAMIFPFVGLFAAGRMPFLYHLRVALAVGLWFSFWFCSQFEVYESRENAGSRWRLSQLGVVSEDMLYKIDSFIANRGNAANSGVQNYDYEYVKEEPVSDVITAPNAKLSLNDAISGVGEVDEEAAKAHYEQWRADTRNSRRPPLNLPLDHPLIGGKAGFVLDKVPNWIEKAHERYVVNNKFASKWKKVKPVFKKDYSEFEPIKGPFGFRESIPEWLPRIFHKELLKAENRPGPVAARKFGTYRKTMWKKDKEVELQSCDGADREKKKKKPNSKKKEE